MQRPLFRRLAAAALVIAATLGVTVHSGTLTVAADQVQPNIIGGGAPTQKYPAGAFVSVKYDAPAHGRFDWHTCTASMTDPRHATIAAHCVTDMPAGLSAEQKAKLAAHYRLDAVSAAIPAKDKQFWVRIGSTHKDSGGYVAKVTIKSVHEKWNWTITPGVPVWDVAVLELEPGAYYDDYTLPLAPSPAQPGEKVYVLGWGVNLANGSGPVPTHIRELQTVVLPDARCTGGIALYDTCVSNVGGVHGPCYGDSGGPNVVIRNGQFFNAGVTSRGLSDRCGVTNEVATGTGFPLYREWVYNAMFAPSLPARPTVNKSPELTRPAEPGMVG